MLMAAGDARAQCVVEVLEKLEPVMVLLVRRYSCNRTHSLTGDCSKAYDELVEEYQAAPSITLIPARHSAGQ